MPQVKSTTFIYVLHKCEIDRYHVGTLVVLSLYIDKLHFFFFFFLISILISYIDDIILVIIEYKTSKDISY